MSAQALLHRARPMVAIAFLVIGALLLALAGYLAMRIVQTAPLFQRSFGAAIPSVPLPFGLILVVIGWRLLLAAPNAQELMSVVGWRRLAIVLFALAAIFGAVFHWFGAVVPVILGCICLLKDPVVAEKVAWLFLS